MSPTASTHRASLKNKSRLKGRSPGTLAISSDLPGPRLSLFLYDKTSCEEKLSLKPSEILPLIKAVGKNFWVRVEGLGDETVLREIAAAFNIHQLTLADIVNRDSRAKVEEFDDHIFVITEAVKESDKGQVEFDQISVIFSGKGVVTFEENHDDILGHIATRLKSGRGQMRELGPDYLVSAILDFVIDSYFPVIEKYTEQLDELEADVIRDARKKITHEIFAMKRSFIMLRRNVFNERESLGDMLRSDNQLIAKGTKRVLRDCFDHIEQIRGMIDVSYSLAAEIMNIHMSFMNQRLNDLMKVLTIISTVFIPLTFLVGVYGMNFSTTAMPKDAANPLNMPELYSPYGYVGFWIFSLILSLGMLWYFRKRGWFGKSID